MKNKQLFDKTVGILVNAYMNGTLQHGDPCGCAVGNLVAAGLGLKVLPDMSWSDGTRGGRTEWDAVHNYGSVEPLLTAYIGKSKLEIDATGYSPYETLKIEKAFES